MKWRTEKQRDKTNPKVGSLRGENDKHLATTTKRDTLK